MSSYKRAKKAAKKYDKTLKATDFQVNTYVRVIHEDGTVLMFKSAFVRWWFDKKCGRVNITDDKNYGIWMLVFTEHNGYHVIAPDDLYDWETLEVRYGEKVYIQ